MYVPDGVYDFIRTILSLPENTEQMHDKNRVGDSETSSHAILLMGFFILFYQTIALLLIWWESSIHENLLQRHVYVTRLWVSNIALKSLMKSKDITLKSINRELFEWKGLTWQISKINFLFGSSTKFSNHVKPWKYVWVNWNWAR